MARDYSAEQRRRNELARERGFTSRSQQRRAIEKGRAPAIRPERLRKLSTIEAQKFLLGDTTQGIERRNSTFPTFGHRSARERCEDWSDIYARSDMAVYDPDSRPEGVTRKQYTDAYMAAFVTGDERYVVTRHQGGSEALRTWFVDINGFFQADEYESRYGDNQR